MLTVLRLFWEFFKTGLFAVGGGLATLPFLYEISEKTGWFTTADIANLIAVSESTPGPLGINMATYVGYKTVGIFGGIITTIGLITPAIVIIIIISKILQKFKDSEVVKRIFYGLRPASTALISAAGLGVAKIVLLNLEGVSKIHSFTDFVNGLSGLISWPMLALSLLLYVGLIKFKKHPIFYVIFAAIFGIIFKL